MDNIGQYLKYDELITELKLAGSNVVSKIRDIILANKTADPGGATFTYTVVVATPVKVGDVINQLGNSAIVKAVSTGPDILQLEDELDGTTDIVNGDAEILRSDKVPRFRGEDIIQTSMDFIDEHTGQFFNKRSGVFTLEGNNTSVMWFPVPIIEITKLLVNSTETELFEGEDLDFVAFKGRARPQDDRRNPRMKLNVGKGRDSIFIGAVTSRIFAKQALTEITGSFGFLEPNGSTPSGIIKATRILSATEITDPSVGASATGGTGPVKRTKVDLHEREFFENKSATSRGSLSGNPMVDQILSKYRSPIRIGGSIRENMFAQSNRQAMIL